MKSINIVTKTLIGFGLITALSCEKEVTTSLPENRNLNDKALVQVYMGTVGATRNYVYVDGTPITGAGLVLGGVFPSTGYAATINPGARNFIIRDTLSTSKQIPLAFSNTLLEKKNYTIFMYDTITSPKQLTVETKVHYSDNANAHLRFANIVYSKTAIPSVDIFSKRKNANLFTNIPVARVTDFITLPTGLSDTLIVRPTGTTTQLAVINSLVLQPERVYTLVFRGSYWVATGTNAKTLSSFTNN